MTVEHLHDALTQLPLDLIVETDKRRSRKAPVIHWQRWAAMAACFALVLFVGRYCIAIFTPKGSMAKSANMEMADEAAPMEQQLLQAAPAAPAPEDAGSSQFMIASGAPILAPGFLDEQWLEASADADPEPRISLFTNAADLEATFPNLADLQDEAWFQSYDLLVVDLYSTAEPSVLDIQETESGWTIVLPQTGEENTPYSLLLTIEKGLIPNADAITLAFS